MRLTELPGAPSRVTVTYAGTSLNYVLADFERAARRSIVRSLAVDTLRISVRFLDQPWDSALASVVQSLGLVSLDLPTGALAIRTGVEDARFIETEPLTSVALRMQSARASVVVQLLVAMMTNRGRVVADTSTNTILLSEVVSRMARLRAFATSLDHPERR